MTDFVYIAVDDYEALLRDALRYRWLRDCADLDLRTLLHVGDFTRIDAAIDASRGEGGAKTEGTT